MHLHPVHGLETSPFSPLDKSKVFISPNISPGIKSILLSWLFSITLILFVNCLFSLFSFHPWTFFKAALYSHNAFCWVFPLYNLHPVRLEFTRTITDNGAPRFLSYPFTTVYFTVLLKPKIVHHLEFHMNTSIFTVCAFKIFLLHLACNKVKV